MEQVVDTFLDVTEAFFDVMQALADMTMSNVADPFLDVTEAFLDVAQAFGKATPSDLIQFHIAQFRDHACHDRLLLVSPAGVPAGSLRRLVARSARLDAAQHGNPSAFLRMSQ